MRFDDVQGIDSAKDELEEIVDFLKSPEKYFGTGAKIPKGALLVGTPAMLSRPLRIQGPQVDEEVFQKLCDEHGRWASCRSLGA